ncbi:MAG: hypothetical protein RLZZ230_933, partial [Candidatus Parcubacteria bacterium]
MTMQSSVATHVDLLFFGFFDPSV